MQRARHAERHLTFPQLTYKLLIRISSTDSMSEKKMSSIYYFKVKLNE